MIDLTNKQLLEEIERRMTQDFPGTITPYYYRKLFEFEDTERTPTSGISLVPDVLRAVCTTHKNFVGMNGRRLAMDLYGKHDLHVQALVNKALEYLKNKGVLKHIYFWADTGDGAREDEVNQIIEDFVDTQEWYKDGYRVATCPFVVAYKASDELLSKDGVLTL